jgi:hypothetical protein
MPGETRTPNRGFGDHYVTITPQTRIEVSIGFEPI